MIDNGARSDLVVLARMFLPIQSQTLPDVSHNETQTVTETDKFPS